MLEFYALAGANPNLVPGASFLAEITGRSVTPENIYFLLSKKNIFWIKLSNKKVNI